jgi:hypothetical protein
MNSILMTRHASEPWADEDQACFSISRRFKVTDPNAQDRFEQLAMLEEI